MRGIRGMNISYRVGQKEKTDLRFINSNSFSHSTKTFLI